jgi:hypothetical protein
LIVGVRGHFGKGYWVSILKIDVHSFCLRSVSLSGLRNPLNGKFNSFFFERYLQNWFKVFAVPSMLSFFWLNLYQDHFDYALSRRGPSL